MIGHPDFDEKASPFIVTVDTSKQGIGCTLSQNQVITSSSDPTKKVTREVIIYFGSRKLTVGESRYSAYKLELTGLVNAIENFRFYLLGRRFLVRTDHKSLEWLRKTTNRKTPAMCFRWQNLLSEYDFTISHVPATQLKLVDSLSRKNYKPGDQGNMIPLLPKRDNLWDDDALIEEARQNVDDEFWIPIMTKKFGDPVKDTNSLADNINCCLWNNDLPTLDLVVAALEEAALHESMMSNQPTVK